MKTLKLAISMSTAVLAIATASTSALAQEAQEAQASSDTFDSGDIVVTAQKRSERLIDVPVAISAISADALTSQNINRLSEYFDRVPGLQYSNQRVSGLALRGVTTGGATAPTVALLVDDVQFGGTTGTGQPPLPDFDASAISRVEVLRGPQGTLYGASSLGGLIKYVLKEPTLNDFSGRIELGGTAVSHGDTGYAVRGSVNLPINDWLAISGSGFKRDDAPYLNNANVNALKQKDVNTRKVWGFRGAALIKPADNFKVILSALRQKTDAMNSDLAITAGGVPICAECVPSTVENPNTAVTNFKPVNGDLTIDSLDSINKAKFALYSARAELDLGGVTVTSISAWSRADNVITSDVSKVFGGLLKAAYGLSTNPTVQIANADRTHKFSQELRLGGDIGTAFTWLAGGFYTIEHAATDQTLIASGSLTGTPYIGAGPGSYREYAGFGDLTWHATDKLDIQVGGRYAHNKQKNKSTLILSPETDPYFGPGGTTIANSSDSAFTWLISPNYHISRDIIAYARVATGYRPGGPNLAGGGDTPKTFDSDSVINYEVGFKGKVVPGLLTIDASLFQIDWKDIQLQATNPVSSLTYLTNGGKARSRGLEFSTNLTPSRGLTIDANLTFTDANLTEDLPPSSATVVGLAGLKGDRLPFSARVAANITANQTFPLADRLEGNVGFTVVYLGDRGGTFVTSGASRPRMTLPGYTTVDVRGGLTFDEVWSANVYVRNMFDKRGVAAADNRNGVNVPTALFIQPRTFGVTLARSF